MRIKSVVSQNLSVSPRTIKPAPKIAVKRGEAATTITTSVINEKPRQPATRSKNALTASILPFSRYSESNGTKACAKAPSPNNRRKKLGTLKAT